MREQMGTRKRTIETVKEKKNKLEKLRFQEEEAERQVEYNKVAEIRYSKIPELTKGDRSAEKLRRKNERLLQEEVDENLIAHIVSKWTGIPVKKMLEGEAAKLLHLENDLSQRSSDKKCNQVRLRSDPQITLGLERSRKAHRGVSCS